MCGGESGALSDIIVTHRSKVSTKSVPRRQFRLSDSFEMMVTDPHTLFGTAVHQMHYIYILYKCEFVYTQVVCLSKFKVTRWLILSSAHTYTHTITYIKALQIRLCECLFTSTGMCGFLSTGAEQVTAEQRAASLRLARLLLPPFPFPPPPKAGKNNKRSNLSKGAA